MPDPCPQCGGIYPSGETCQQRFEACLALDYENPEIYAAVHLLTVACYMLQHNLYSRQGWLETRQMIAQAIHLGFTSAEIRVAYQRRLDSGQRSWSVTRGEKLAEFDAIQWSYTIADLRLDSPEQYVADVKHWAECVLNDTAGIGQT
jgi:DNA-binding transcriptional MerR regulator